MNDEQKAIQDILELVERWETALSVDIHVAFSPGGSRQSHTTHAYMKAECKLRDAVDRLRIARGEPVGSERVLPSYGELEKEALEEDRVWLDGGGSK